MGYTLLAASPVPEETVLEKGWIRSFESVYAESGTNAGNDTGNTELFPFEIVRPDTIRFGYFNREGVFMMNRVTQKNLSLSENRFAEYEALPRSLEVKNAADETISRFEHTNGYPLFMDGDGSNGKTYLVHFEQNAVSEISGEGDVLWTYTFASPITCVAGAQGRLLVGTLGGTVELLDEKGRRVFFFETGGSRITCIYGVAVSRDLSYIAVISGLDDQRFLLFEQSAGSYRITHHEFIGDGKRRPMRIQFIDNDTRLAFERDEGLELYEIKSRMSYQIPLDGEIALIDNEGGDGLLFLVTRGKEGRNHLIGVKYPATVVLKTPFQSEAVFLRRAGGDLFVGSDRNLSAFSLAGK
ncbi:MAG: WD40 repeat domain-containing protein [Spirochaetaceae bacterium]|nr:WD40 repeat domain-containing protein [Spirochaetaceae bacterium]